MEQKPKSPRERAGALISLLISDWRPTAWQVLWAVRIGVILGLLVAIGYSYDITLWDWLKLLVVPAVIAAGGLWFNQQQQERQREDDRRQQERGLEIENQRAQDEALQAYLDQMSQLLTDKERPLRGAEPGDNLSTVARAQTLTILERLQPRRKDSVMRFLFESRLITKKRPIFALYGADFSHTDMSNRRISHTNLYGINLDYAELRKADLIAASLRSAKLRHTKLSAANLREADLSDADLEDAILERTILSQAVLEAAKLKNTDLRGVALNGANLSRANLEGADISAASVLQVGFPSDLEGANFSGANLQKVNLSEANLSEANLNGADLRKANLTDAKGLTNEELERQTFSLEGATMPNGQKYEDWLKSIEP